MLKGHLPKVIYHQVYQYTKINPCTQKKQVKLCTPLGCSFVYVGQPAKQDSLKQQIEQVIPSRCLPTVGPMI